MPTWLNALLLFIFAVHLVLFFRLFLKRNELYYLAASLTFLLLVATFSIALWLPQLGWLFWCFRIAAWVSALISIGWLVMRRVQKRRQS